MPIERVLSLCAIVLLAGCANPNARYTKLVPLPFKEKYPNVIVDLNAQKVKVAPSGKTVFDLSPQAQAVLLQDMLRQRKPGQTDAQIAQDLIGIKGKETTKDLSRFPMQIVVTTRYDKVHYPDGRADRLEFLSVRITPHEAEFESLDKLDTQYGTISLGTVTRESDFALSAELDPSIAGVGAKLTPSFTRKNTDAHNLNSRFVQLSGELSPGHVSLFEQGAEGQDLVGNTIFQLNIHEMDTSVWTIFEAPALQMDGALIPAGKVRLSKQDVVMATRPVTADVKYRYYIRHIVKGARTTGEYDDKIQFVHGICSETVNLDAPVVEGLSTNGQASGSISAAPLGRGGAAKARWLLFGSSSDAGRFALWLRHQNSGTVANYRLIDANRQPLSPSEMATLQMVQIRSLFDPPAGAAAISNGRAKAMAPGSASSPDGDAANIQIAGSESRDLVCRSEADTTARGDATPRANPSEGKTSSTGAGDQYDDGYDSPDQRDGSATDADGPSPSVPRNPS